MAWRARRESKQAGRFVSDFISFPVAKKAKTCKAVETQYEIDVTEARKRLEIHSRASALNSMCDVKERLPETVFTVRAHWASDHTKQPIQQYFHGPI